MSVYRQPVPKPNSWRSNPKAKDYIRTIEDAAKAHDLDPELLGALIERESQFDPQAKSHAGAIGIAQIMQRFHPDVDATDPTASIKYAAQYLKQNFARFGDMERALAAYNHGPTAVRSYGKDWRTKIPAETHKYILELLRKE